MLIKELLPRPKNMPLKLLLKHFLQVLLLHLLKVLKPRAPHSKPTIPNKAIFTPSEVEQRDSRVVHSNRDFELRPGHSGHRHLIRAEQGVFGQDEVVADQVHVDRQIAAVVLLELVVEARANVDFV